MISVRKNFPQADFLLSPIHLGEVHWLIGCQICKDELSSALSCLLSGNKKPVVSRQFSCSSKAGCFLLKVPLNISCDNSILLLLLISEKKLPYFFFPHCDVSYRFFGRYLVLDPLSCHGLFYFFNQEWMLNFIKLFSILIEVIVCFSSFILFTGELNWFFYL